MEDELGQGERLTRGGRTIHHKLPCVVLCVTQRDACVCSELSVCVKRLHDQSLLIQTAANRYQTLCVFMCVLCMLVLCACAYACVFCVCCVCQVREALDGREAVLLSESRRLYDSLQHTLDDRVMCCDTLTHMTQASVSAARGYLTTLQDAREGHAIAPITLVLARAELDALGASSLEVAGHVGEVRVECDVPVRGVNDLCRAIGEMGNVASYCDDAVGQLMQRQQQQPPPQPPPFEGDIL